MANTITYGNFTFPFNPETTSLSVDKEVVKHKYLEIPETDLEDMGANAIIISGSGVFFGVDAKANWDALLKEFSSTGVKAVSHPYFSSITRGIMTHLEASLDPTPNCVEYKFEIVADGSLNRSKRKSYVITTRIITHKVKKGETLSKICYYYRKKYNIGKSMLTWKQVAKANKIKHPNSLKVGKKLKLTLNIGEIKYVE